MVFITKETWRSNGVEVIVFNGKKWLNGKHIEEQLEHSNLREVTSKCPLDLRKQRQELQKCDKQSCRRFVRGDFAVQIIIDCRTTHAVNFKSRLGFNQYDPVMTQEQSILSKTKTIFSDQEIIIQHCVLGYYTDAYSLKYKLAIEIDELGQQNRDINQRK